MLAGVLTVALTITVGTPSHAASTVDVSTLGLPVATESLPLQQFAVAPGTKAADCAAQAPIASLWTSLAGLDANGWSISYAASPNAGAGGWVCTRQLKRQGTGWTFA